MLRTGTAPSHVVSRGARGMFWRFRCGCSQFCSNLVSHHVSGNFVQNTKHFHGLPAHLVSQRVEAKARGHGGPGRPKMQKGPRNRRSLSIRSRPAPRLAGGGCARNLVSRAVGRRGHGGARLRPLLDRKSAARAEGVCTNLVSLAGAPLDAVLGVAAALARRLAAHALGAATVLAGREPPAAQPAGSGSVLAVRHRCHLRAGPGRHRSQGDDVAEPRVKRPHYRAPRMPPGRRRRAKRGGPLPGFVLLLTPSSRRRWLWAVWITPPATVRLR